MTRIRRQADWLIGAVLFLFAFAIYVRTLAPGVVEMFDDSLEFQLIASRMAIAHPTGYPLFSILLKLLTYLPFGEIAYRVNLGTAFFAAFAVATLYAAARQLPCSRLAAAAAALLFAFGPTFWSQAVLVEVYALQMLLTAALLYLALRWGRSRDHSSLVTLSFFAGLLLTHHRMSVLLFPALAVYVLAYNHRLLRQPRVLAPAAAALVLPLFLYLYIPIRGLATSSLDGGYQNTLSGFFGWIFGTAYNVFLSGNPFNEHRAASFYLDLFLNEF
ncbi:MAG: protein O-mannosyl-transferase family, partial [Rudaea sp.]